MLIRINHPNFMLRGLVCSPPFSGTSRSSDKTYRSAPLDEAVQRQTDRCYSVTAESGENRSDVEPLSPSGCRSLKAVDITLTHIRTTSWNAAPCPPRENDSRVF